MSLLCFLGLHRPLASKVWNDGHYFTACARCHKTLIRTPNSRWHRVPPHLQVVWKQRTEDDVVWPSHVL